MTKGKIISFRIGEDNARILKNMQDQLGCSQTEAIEACIAQCTNTDIEAGIANKKVFVLKPLHGGPGMTIFDSEISLLTYLLCDLEKYSGNWDYAIYKKNINILKIDEDERNIFDRDCVDLGDYKSFIHDMKIKYKGTSIEKRIEQATVHMRIQEALSRLSILDAWQKRCHPDSPKIGHGREEIEKEIFKLYSKLDRLCVFNKDIIDWFGFFRNQLSDLAASLMEHSSDKDYYKGEFDIYVEDVYKSIYNRDHDTKEFEALESKLKL